MLAVHNVSTPPRRVNTGLKNTKTTPSKSCKLPVSSHCSSDSDSSHQDFQPKKRFRFDTNYCGLESTLRQMNVEQEGENSPDETSRPSNSSFLTNFGSNRKRQSSLSFSPTQNKNNNQIAAKNGLKSCSNTYFQKQQEQQQQQSQNSNPTNQQFKSQQLFNKCFSTPKSNQQSSSSSTNFSTSFEQDSAIETNNPLMKTFVKKFNYKRRLKHLPSQTQNSTTINKSPSSISLKNTGNKLHLADALTIFEEMLSEREEKLREEFHMELQNKLAEQYEQFVRYNEDAVRAKFDNSCSYLS